MSRSNVKVALLVTGVVAALTPLVLTAPPERPRLVTVYAWKGGETPERATGFVVAPGRVVTVAHVLDGAVRVEVRRLAPEFRGFPGSPRDGAAGGAARAVIPGGGAARAGLAGAAAMPARGATGAALVGTAAIRARGGAASIVRTDRTLDLAVLRVPGVTGPRVRFGDESGELRLLAARAVPAEVRRRVNARLVDQPGRPRRPSLEVAAEVLPGDSGAPVVDAGGAVVGVVYARSTRHGATAYAVRAAGVRGIIEG